MKELGLCTQLTVNGSDPRASFANLVEQPRVWGYCLKTVVSRFFDFLCGLFDTENFETLIMSNDSVILPSVPYLEGPGCLTAPASDTQ